jgi:sugar phosphate isomerase/epimerase
MENLLAQVHVSVPFPRLRDEFLPLILSNRIPVEISFEAQVLDADPEGDYRRIAGELSQAGLKCSFHGPFLDLSPGAIDPEIRRVSLRRMEQVLALIPIFNPRWVVCHAAYDSRRYRDQEGQWLANAQDSFRHLLVLAERTNTPLMVENVFEDTTRQLEALFHGLSNRLLHFCLDVGHHRLFGREPLPIWVERLGHRLGMLHLHDNLGEVDDHLALGTGSIDFKAFFTLLKENGLKPFITLEAHREDWVRQSLAFLALHWTV